MTKKASNEALITWNGIIFSRLVCLISQIPRYQSILYRNAACKFTKGDLG